MMQFARPSAEALAFLAQERPRLPALTSASAWAFREAIRVDTLPRAERALERHPVALEESIIMGVRCLIVTPPNHEGGMDMLYFFGGGYFSGSPREDLILAAPLAAYSGRRIIMVDYRLAPEHPYPAAVDDGFAVYGALASAGPFSLIGESAGGNLALVMLHRAKRAGMRLPDRVALFSPWCDLTPDGVTARNPDGDDPTLTPGMNHAAISIYSGGVPTEAPEISPVFADWSDPLPEFMISTGSRDLLRNQVLHLADRLHRAPRVVLREYPQLWHVFEFYDEIPEAEDSLRAFGAFLK